MSFPSPFGEGLGVRPCSSLIHLQQLLNILTAVSQSRHLMLSAQFAFAFQPIVKQALSCLNHFQLLQRDVLMSFRLVVAVKLLQTEVECLGKGIPQAIGVCIWPRHP